MRIFRSIITIIVCAFVLLATFSFFVLPKKDFLESENRKAAQFPKFDFTSLADGTYTSGIEEFTKDQFPAREFFMGIKTEAQLAVGYREISDTYIGDDRLFQKVTEPDGKKFCDGVKRISEKIDTERVTVSVMLLPTASYVHSEEMPKHAPQLSQKNIIDKTLAESGCENALDLCDLLTQAKTSDEAALFADGSDCADMFYAGDHHWTTYAAYTAYNAFCDSRELSHGSIDDYEITVMSDAFRGTLCSRVPSGRIRSDKIIRFDRKGAEPFKAYYADSVTDIIEGNYTEYSYYRDEALEKKDKYTYFGGDNFPVVVLKNENAATDREIVVAKDSFANSFAPFLTENFSAVYMLDCRYLKGKTVSDFVNENENVTDVLILYGLNSLNDNSGIAMLN